APIDYGYVGDVVKVDGEMLANLLQGGTYPVVAPITHDGKGNLLNTNADTIASEVAKGVAEKFDVTLIYCFEKPGVLMDENDDNSVIPLINRQKFEELKATGIVSGGMLPKLQSAFKALEAGVKEVVITHASAIDNPQAGTHIVL
ncbi:MAG: acetylglutamate kinase, partial [Bacteroidales bacterium]|nr:acetylglutamate kinase [Bacteroidales bacterium]